MLGVVGQQCCVRLPGALRLPIAIAPIGSDVQLIVIVQVFILKEMQKEHLSSAPMSPNSTLRKEPLQMPPFHMTVTTAILVFQANPVRVELFTSYVNTHFLIV